MVVVKTTGAQLPLSKKNDMNKLKDGIILCYKDKMIQHGAILQYRATY